MERVLALGCHIDDIELGCGGTLLKHEDIGDTIYMAVLKADDSLAGKPQERVQEQRKSAERLKANLHMFLHNKSVSKIVHVIETSFVPTRIYFPYKTDHHQDHIKAFLVGQAIGRNPGIDLFGYLITTSFGYNPNYFSIIDIDKKKELVNIFKTQVNRKDRYIQMMESQNKFFGTLVGEEDKCAEGFVQYRSVWR